MYRILFFIVILAASCTPKRQLAVVNNPSPMPEDFNWQGHRGARGLLPENTVIVIRVSWLQKGPWGVLRQMKGTGLCEP